MKSNIEASLHKLDIYCDGGCLGNPGEAGSGLSVYLDDEPRPILIYGQYAKKGTNNTAELHALLHALSLASISKAAKITILSDSKYSIDCVTKWAYGWKKKGWTKKGGEIKNLDLIKDAHSLYDTLKDLISVKYVKGHSGIEGNELADRMAGIAITNKTKNFTEYKYSSIPSVLAL